MRWEHSNHVSRLKNICNLLPIGIDVSHNHFLGRNCYDSKRPKRQQRALPLAFVSSALVGVLLALVERIGMNKIDWTMDCLTPTSWDCAHTRRHLLSSFYCYPFFFMAPIPPSCRRGYQFRVDELNNCLDIVENYLPISLQNWQSVADVHLENYHQEAQMAKSLHCKFQEIARRTGPTGDPNCPDYVIRAKPINRHLVLIIDASSGGLEAKRSEDGLSDGYESDDTGVAAGEFSNVINKLNNASANGGEEADEEEDADDVRIGVDNVVAPAEGVRGNNGVPGAAGNGVAADVAGVVAAAVARSRGRGPGRSRAPQPAGAAGVVHTSPADVAAAGVAAAAALKKNI
jgi:hypothetical protein